MTRVAIPARRAPFPRKRLLKSALAVGQRIITPTVDEIDQPQTTQVNFQVNGTDQNQQVRVNETLAETLRDSLGLTGTKLACDDGSCGTCTVLMDRRAVYACLVLTLDCAASEVLTIEGLGSEASPHPLQSAYADLYAAQCGFCTPGMIMAAKALLDRIPDPSEEDVRLGLSGVLCRCGYRKIIEATLDAAARMRGDNA